MSESEEQTKFLMGQIGEYKPSQRIIDLSKEAETHKENIKEKTHVINQIQELIPDSGVATNYKVNFAR